MFPKICIVGGGIIGLSTGLYIKKQNPNYNVTIITEKITPDTTADGAAGIWSPYLLSDTPKDLQRLWAQDTHDFIESLWNSPDGGRMGISLVSASRLNQPESDPSWKNIVYGFRSMSPREVDGIGRLNGKHTNGYEFVTYTIEPVKLLPYFLSEFESLGGKVKVTGTKVTDLTSLDPDFDIVVNCTGVWAGQLVNDPKVVPLRGQVVRVEAPWIKRVILDDADDGNYVISNQDTVVLGGTHQKSDWNTTPYDEDRNFIMTGCATMMPSEVNGAKFVKDFVGLRPGRSAVRIERETLYRKDGSNLQVVHNYGHGGSGITLFWGCARQAFGIIKQIQNEKGILQHHKAKL